MGNAHGALAHCFFPSSADDGGQRRRRRRRFLSSSAVASETIPDEGLGHSFCYVPPPPSAPSHATSANLTKVCHSDHETSTSFRIISGAAISANPMAPPSTDLLAAELLPRPPAASFEGSPSFASVPLQRLARFSASSSSSSSSGGGTFSASAFRGFMSAPLEKHTASILFSGPLEKPTPSAFSAQLSRSSSHGLPRPTRTSTAAKAFRSVAKAVSRAVSRDSRSAEGLNVSNSIDASGGGLQQPSSSSSNWLSSSSGGNSSSNLSYGGDAPESHVDGAHQWAQGKAGEDRVHVVVSEEHGWVFVGIYDGFNGPDATDFLQSKLYSAVHEELTGLLWEDKEGVAPATRSAYCNDSEDASISTNSDARKGYRSKGRKTTLSGTWEENRRQCNPHWAKEGMERQRRVTDKLRRPNVDGAASHLQVLKALSRALRKTEDTFFDIADKMASENPELALMGSCVLVMLMKGEDVYLMNVGDSRAVMAQQDPWSSTGKARQELRSIKEEYATCVGAHGGCVMDGLKNLKAMQLTMDHNTSVEEEVRRIRKEHPCDSSAIANGRVKGSLKVTRAFGAGYLKQPKWNDALLEMFRIDYVGTSPYITCDPFLYHQKLRPMDKFLILSSDGLYQYFTNEEVVAQVEMFVTATPDGDPAQHLVEEVLLRAAKRAGMDLQELLNVPHGERRRYHDDISIVVISLEGKIWRSWV